MPEQLQDKTIFSLLEVTRSIAKTLQERYGSTFWVQAEMNKLNFYQRSGHCYPELVEKKDGKVIAQLKAHIWKEDYLRIDAEFRKVLKEPLKDGIKILFRAKITFDPGYGLSLWIQDIDPGFTLGDLEREKQETIQRLQQEQIFRGNKSLALPLLPQRIAIISVETSKGYADFLQVIDHNPFGYRFFHMLFPSLLQGDKAVDSMIAQLDRIRIVQTHFDAVAIIRGGGGDVGLSCYNHYALAKAIATFPLPVFTGIGHATNETVCEMISHTNGITPTKVGEMLIQKFHNFSVPVQNAQELIMTHAQRVLSEEQFALQSASKLFRAATLQMISKHRYVVHSTETLVRTESIQYLRAMQHEVALLERSVLHLDPAQVLKRGYSITTHKGKVITDATQVTPGDVLQTRVYRGVITSTVQSTNTNETHE